MRWEEGVGGHMGRVGVDKDDRGMTLGDLYPDVRLSDYNYDREKGRGNVGEWIQFVAHLRVCPM